MVITTLDVDTRPVEFAVMTKVRVVPDGSRFGAIVNGYVKDVRAELAETGGSGTDSD